MSQINIEVDDELVSEAQKVTGLQTKTEVVQFALRELIGKKLSKTRLRDFIGKIDFYDGFDPRRLRADRDLSD